MCIRSSLYLTLIPRIPASFASRTTSGVMLGCRYNVIKNVISGEMARRRSLVDDVLGNREGRLFYDCLYNLTDLYSNAMATVVMGVTRLGIT
jgi:hypothetical protein